jgi:hypothetical protein
MDSAGCSSGSAQHAPKKAEKNIYSFFRLCSTLDCIHREKRIWMFPVFIGLLQTIDVIIIYILSKTGALVLGHVMIH